MKETELDNAPLKGNVKCQMMMKHLQASVK